MIDGFNEAGVNIAPIYLKVGDEYMSAIRFFTTSKGGLPHLSYIFYNPGLLVVEFNMVACSVTGSLILLEIQRGGGGGIKSIWYNLELGATAACTKRLM